MNVTFLGMNGWTYAQEKKARSLLSSVGLSHPVVSGEQVIFTWGAGKDWSREPCEVVLYTLSSRTEETVSGTDTRPGKRQLSDSYDQFT